MTDTPTSFEFRTAAKVLRWGIATAQQQLDAMPWWKRIFNTGNIDEMRFIIVACEAEADASEGSEP